MNIRATRTTRIALISGLIGDARYFATNDHPNVLDQEAVDEWVRWSYEFRFKLANFGSHITHACGHRAWILPDSKQSKVRGIVEVGNYQFWWTMENIYSSRWRWSCEPGLPGKIADALKECLKEELYG
jgi:hypothetical protein